MEDAHPYHTHTEIRSRNLKGIVLKHLYTITAVNYYLGEKTTVVEQFGSRICTLNPFAILPLNHEIINLAQVPEDFF